MLLLSDLLGSTVRSVDGEVVGDLVDLSAPIGDDHPSVGGLAVGHRRRIRWVVAWDAVGSFEQGDIRLTISGPEVRAHPFDGQLADRELLLARDVLDTQIIDVAGRRVTRVSDVLLARADTTVRVAAVEVGAAGVWRRLGLRRFADDAPEQAVDWHDLHLTSARGHALQLATPDAALHRLGASDLASVVAHLPTPRAAEVLDAVSPAAAASALSASHPRVGARLLRGVSRGTATSLVTRMPVDDATAVLRGLPPDEADAVLGGLVSERAATLRRLLAHPAGTAGGLMNTEVQTARADEPVATIRSRLAVDLPELEGLATVVVVDGDGRPLGTYEPIDLLGDRTAPRQVPVIPVTSSVERVIDLFALQDHLALPVVDSDGRLVGIVAVDDVLEELLAERLPGRGRYARIRQRVRPRSPLGHRRRSPAPGP